MRRSVHVARVLDELLKDPAVLRYGLEFTEASSILPGTLHPILKRLRTAGWIEDVPENVDPRVVLHRPTRWYFRLTDAGVIEARAYLARYRPPRFPPVP